MLDLFSIFSKGGIVLWCFQNTGAIFTPSVNVLLRSVILQERTGNNSFDHNGLELKYKLDNEFELVYVVGYQKILQLSYVDKLLNDVHLEFRDKYKNDLRQAHYFQDFDFDSIFESVMHSSQKWSKHQLKIPKNMRSFEQSFKSKKTVASMIEKKTDEKENKKNGKSKKRGLELANGVINNHINIKSPDFPSETRKLTEHLDNDSSYEDLVEQNRLRLNHKFSGNNNKGKGDKQKSPRGSKEVKKPRVWDLEGNHKDTLNLDRTKDRPMDDNELEDIQPDTRIVGQMIGGIQDLEVLTDSEESEEDENEAAVATRKDNRNSLTNNGRSVFSMFRGLVGNKNLTNDDMQPVLEKLKDHLISKNVASDIAHKLCNSVAAKLDGKVLGTFESVATTVKTTLTDALVQILSPRRRVDILRDAMEARKQGRPYAMTFCGVNGVGKSTNLAKICFWLIENNFRVLIAACDTFRAGAVEQLRTHTRHLNALHPPNKHGGQQMVQLYEKGYGKDAAGIAMEAITFAKDQNIDIVLVDTAGRMQDKEPLMRALAKLILVNQPDLVLFVGEALVGNEAVDQLVKFNQAIADYSASTNPHLIDGIVLTKFDTIDDKVGAAISMTYITGQPIVFVGTGQTYTDLKSLNAKAVVHALMK